MTYEEKQNELMNRISLALNDATLQQGFEIICKRISDLEKENEGLKAQVEQLSNDNHVLKTSFITQQEQIEKMKCCENCKRHRKCTCTEDNKFYARASGKCDFWELAE